MIPVNIPEDFVVAAWRYANEVVNGYANGEFDASRKYSIRGAESNPELWAKSKVAEGAVAVWAGLDPWKAVRFNRGADGGLDLWIGKLSIDVKNTNTHSLIWSAKKPSPISKHFHAFISTTVLFPPTTVELHGWIGRIEFIGKATIAEENHPFDNGTMFVDRADLHDMATFPLPALA